MGISRVWRVVATVVCLLALLTGCGRQENKVQKVEPLPSPAADTIGESLRADFKTRMQADSSVDPQELAEALLTNEKLSFQGMTMEVEEGNLSGFSAEIKGFDKGIMFSPTIGSIPFVGYIFTVSQNQDADTLMELLKANANPRWNICTEAEETIVDSSGNIVFFLMCPKDFEE